ncbi:hypothetical protein OE88DRAFT_293787 [Heliocybe sulcata]|uniref:Uncharacterized protein n=1 Tax=Heliocybe sulcata TaxID=5364 RepID=A0A5C3N1K5_9AGAM|nr:hypothetical protein OE88DRAFT_293787 [Heliocybe sulcata]
MDGAAWRADTEDLVRFALSVYRRSRVSFALHLHERLVPLVVLLFSVFSIALLSAPLRRKTPVEGSKEAIHSALPALLRFICPSGRSVWPPSYAALAKRASKSKKKLFVLPVDLLLHDILLSNVELRNAPEVLPALFRAPLAVGHYQLSLQVSKGLRAAAVRWFLSSQMLNVFYQPAPLSARIFEPEKHLPPPTPSRHPSLELTLDSVRSAHVESWIRALKNTCEKGETVAIHFTTLNPSVHLWSKELVLCAVPFLPRRYQGKDKKRTSNAATRTSAPLATPVHRILELLTSGNSGLDVISLNNISADYLAGLNHHAQNVEDNRNLRTTMIDDIGLEGWREERLMFSWEAGLYAANLLTRWVIMLRK